MTGPRKFGQAVDAALSDLKENPNLERELDFDWITRRYGEPEHQSYTLAQRAATLKAWASIHAMVKRVDRFWVQLPTPNGRVPDLVLKKGTQVVVLDIKTGAPNTEKFWSAAYVDKAVEQTVGAAKAWQMRNHPFGRDVTHWSARIVCFDERDGRLGEVTIYKLDLDDPYGAFRLTTGKPRAHY